MRTANHLLLAAILAASVSGCAGFFDPLDISDRSVVMQIVDANPEAPLAELKAKIESRTGFSVKDIERGDDGKLTVWAVPESEALGAVVEKAMSDNILNNPTPVGLLSGLLGVLMGVAGVNMRYRKKYRPKPGRSINEIAAEALAAEVAPQPAVESVSVNLSPVEEVKKK